MEAHVEIEASCPPSGATTAQGDRGAPAPLGLRLRLGDGREVPVGRCLQIGSAPGNDLVLNDPFVSAVHCTIVQQAGRMVLKDMGSRNGCWLGSARVRLAELAPGSRLTLGGTTCDIVVATDDEHPMLGAGEAMARVRRQLARLGPTGLPVLLLGESGTGKELAAHALHEASGRRGRLVALNCGALPPEMAESELFGHERGAFTGALARRPGVFEEAEGGTLFLDEIGELPMKLQPKLLRALESGAIRSVGGTGERRVNVRIVAATHKDLVAACRGGSFRLDLYHRLAAVEVRLPSLRERPDDIPLLARHFLEASGCGGPSRQFSPAAVEAMAAHPWPGNVRELRNAVTRAAHLGGSVIETDDLFPALPAPRGAVHGYLAALDEDQPLPSLELVQRQLVERALRQHGGSVRAAARSLGVPHSTLHDRVKRWGMKRGDE